MHILNLHPKLMALPLAVTLLLNMLPATVYAADDGVSNPDISLVVDSGAPAGGTEKIALMAAEDTIDTSTWDANFVAALKSDYPELFSGENLLKTAVESLTVLNVAEKNIQSLAGIEYFTGVEVVECNNNNLTALDVSNNPTLISLDCGYNNLTVLDVSNNPALQSLRCEYNNLSALDLSNNIKLGALFCFENKLTTLELPNSTELGHVNCHSNNLTALDISNNPALTELYCNINNLVALDVSNNPALTRIDCGNNKLSALDVSNVPALDILDCFDNNLTDLDVSNNQALTWLNLQANNLTDLDISNNLALDVFDCSINNLTDLDVSNNLALTSLSCGDNNLTSLDVSQNIALNLLYCIGNPIQHLVLPTGEELTVSIQPSNGGSVMMMYRSDGNYFLLPTKEAMYSATPADGYTFEGWTGDVNSSDSEVLFKLSGNMTVIANFSKAAEQPDTYTVTFQDWDGTTLKTETVNSGETATAPEAPIRTGYTFTGWDQSFDVVTSDLVVTAQYTQNSTAYSITFQDWDGTTLKTETVNSGETATAPEAPTRTGYTFTGWDQNFDVVTSDLVVTAQYTQKTADEILEDAKELDPSDTEKVEELEDIYKSLTNVSVNVVADPNTHGNFKNNIDAIQVVGAAFNAEPNDTVRLHFSKPASNVTIDGTRYKTNSAVQLDIKLLKNSVPMQDLAVSVTITVPIPTGVAEKDFWILHYHNDGSLERIRPTVNGDGTCTFTVNRFSVFAFVNAVEQNTNNNNTSSGGSGSSHTSGDYSDSSDTSSSTSSFAALSPNEPAIPKGTLSTQQAVSKTHAAVEKAKQSGAAQAIVHLKNMETLTPEAAQAIVKAANGVPVSVQADSTLNNGKVNVRLSFAPAQITNIVQLAAFIDSVRTKSVRTLFNKYFENDIQVVRFAQKDDLGIPVNIAVKLDTKLRGKALYFYRYNQANNAYAQLADPQYWVDTNGYVHFVTKLAGCIVISDGPLMEK